MGILAALGGRGVTVVLSIHQPRPDVLRLMDRALILSGFGEVVYSGEHQICQPGSAGTASSTLLVS